MFRSVPGTMVLWALTACTVDPGAPSVKDSGPGDPDAGAETDVAPNDTGRPPDTDIAPPETDVAPDTDATDTFDTASKDTYLSGPVYGDIEVMRRVGYDAGAIIEFPELVVVARRVHGPPGDRWFIAQDASATASKTRYGGLAVRTKSEMPPEVGDVVHLIGSYEEYPPRPASPPPVTPYHDSLATLVVTPMAAGTPDHSLTVLRKGEALPDPITLTLAELATPATAPCQQPPFCGAMLLEALESMRVRITLPAGSSTFDVSGRIRTLTNTKGVAVTAKQTALTIDLIDMLTPMYGNGDPYATMGLGDSLTSVDGVLISQGSFRRIAPSTASDVGGYVDVP